MTEAFKGSLQSEGLKGPGTVLASYFSKQQLEGPWSTRIAFRLTKISKEKTDEPKSVSSGFSLRRWGRNLKTSTRPVQLGLAMECTSPQILAIRKDALTNSFVS